MFVTAHQREKVSMTELCAAFGIARKTGYKWLSRYAELGVEGLKELSRATHTHLNAVEPAVVDLIAETRRAWPSWGPKKLLGYLEPRWPDLHFPAASTVSEILRRRGLSRPRRRRPTTAKYAGPLQVPQAPNDVWAIDFKGHFCLGDGRKCTPLTISDVYSRFLVRCESTLRTDFTIVRFHLVSAFREYGMPAAIRSDNGPPFASSAPGGISRFAVLLIRLGVRPERIEKGKPTQNGIHERMHRTLKQETTRPPQKNRLAQQHVFDVFRREFNDVRPHEALGQLPPASRYELSPRVFTGALRDPEYPDAYEVTRVRTDGSLKWNGHHFLLTDVLAGELVGLERTEAEWRLHYGPLELGALDNRGRFRKKRDEARKCAERVTDAPG